MEDRIIMSQKELRRKSIFDLVKLDQISQIDASERLGLSYRQTKRSYQRYLREGDQGLVHKSRGKSSPRAYAEAKQQALKLYQEKYLDFGPTFAAEKMVEEDGFVVHHETLRLWLKAAGLWHRKRKRKQHRSRRERRSRFGELLQLDGSIHAWFGLLGNKKQCLMNLVDDATGKTLAWMDQGETTDAAFRVLKQWIKLHGIPLAIYVDLKNVYVSPKSLKDITEEDNTDQDWFTQFSKACHQLGIKIIKAYSPQAKGRVERSHGMYQDRFVKELKLKGITTISEANKLLYNGFLDKVNEKFVKGPASLEDAHMQLSEDQDLDRILCWEFIRVVANDWTVRFNNQCFQIKKTQPILVRAKQKITVKRHLDGNITLWAKDKELAYVIIENKSKSNVRPMRNFSSTQRSQLSRANKSKTPWGQFNSNWLKKTEEVARYV